MVMTLGTEHCACGCAVSGFNRDLFRHLFSQCKKSMGSIQGELSKSPLHLTDAYSKAEEMIGLSTSYCSHARPTQPGPNRTRLCGPYIAAISGG